MSTPIQVAPTGSTAFALSDTSAATAVLETIAGILDFGFYYTNRYVEYTLNVATAGSYNLTVVYATYKAGSTLQAAVNGTAAGTLQLPSTGSYNKYLTTAPVAISLPAGTVKLRLTNNSPASFNVSGVSLAAKPAPPPAPTINVNSAVNPSVSPGETVTLNVSNASSEARDWVAIFNSGANPDGTSGYLSWAFLNGLQTEPAAPITSAAVKMNAPQAGGNYEARYYHDQPRATPLASAPFSVTGPAVVPVAIAFSPSAPQVPDNSPAGALVAAASVTMSDGSTFNGTLSVQDPKGTFTASGMNIVTARQLSSADDTPAGSPDVITVTATTVQGASFSVRLGYTRPGR